MALQPKHLGSGGYSALHDVILSASSSLRTTS
jgi:hypothetical protein